MEEVDFTFLVFTVDTRPVDEFKAAVENVFGCVFAPERGDRPAAELEGRFEVEALGIYISLQASEPWPEGFVYRITGGTATRFYAPGARLVDLELHIRRLLQEAGAQQVLSRVQFVARRDELSMLGR